MWFLFSLVALLGWGFADLFYKKGTDETDPHSHLKIAVWVGLVMGVCSLFLIPFAEHPIDPVNFIRYAPASACYILSMVIGYAGMRYLELSILSPVQNSSGAFSAVMMTVFFLLTSKNVSEAVTEETGFVFTDASPLETFNNVLIAVGILAVTVGLIALAVVEKRLNSSPTERKYRLGALALIFPLLYCLFDTLGTAADGIILDEERGLGLGEIDVLVYYGLTFFAFGIGCWLYMLLFKKKVYNPFAKKELVKGGASCFEEFGQVFYVFAMAAEPVLAAPIIGSYCIVSVILSRVFLKEKLTKKQYLCIAACIAGIVMLGISEGIGEL